MATTTQPIIRIGLTADEYHALKVKLAREKRTASEFFASAAKKYLAKKSNEINGNLNGEKINEEKSE